MHSIAGTGNLGRGGKGSTPAAFHQVESRSRGEDEVPGRSRTYKAERPLCANKEPASWVIRKALWKLMSRQRNKAHSCPLQSVPRWGCIPGSAHKQSFDLHSNATPSSSQKESFEEQTHVAVAIFI